MKVSKVTFEVAGRGRTIDFYPFRAIVEILFLVGSMYFGLALLDSTLIVVAIAVCCARHFDHSGVLRVVANIAYVPLLVFAFDGISPLPKLVYHAGFTYCLILVVCSLLPAVVLARIPVLQLRWSQGLLIGLMVTLLIETQQMTAAPSAASCARSRSDARLEFVLDYKDLPKMDLIPRFLETDPEHKTLFVGLRFATIGSDEAECLYGIVVKNLETGKVVSPNLNCGEAVGMAFDPFEDALVAVLVYKDQRTKPIHASLTWIDRRGQVTRSVPLADLPWNEHLAAVIPGSSSVRVLTELNQEWIFRRDTRQVVVRPVDGLSFVDYLVIGDAIYTASAGSLISTFFRPSLAAYSLTTHNCLVSSPTILFGSWLVAFDDVRREFYSDSLFSGTVIVLNSNLQPFREIRLGGAMRTIALDSKRRRGYAANYVSGEITAFDLDTGLILGKIPTNKGARVIRVEPNGDILSGCGCGVVRVRRDQFH